MALKFTLENVKEAMIDRFYGVSYEEILENYDMSRAFIKKLTHNPDYYRGTIYWDAFHDALTELDVTYNKYLEELHKHVLIQRSKARKGVPNKLRSLSREQVYQVLRILFEKPITTGEVSELTGVSKPKIHRIRYRQSYQDITEEYIRSHRIKNPEQYLERGPMGRGRNGSPQITDDNIRRFFYLYMSGASREKAMKEAMLTNHTVRPLLALKHPTKNALMLELILSEGFTPWVFKEFVRKKNIRAQRDGRIRQLKRDKQLQTSQER